MIKKTLIASTLFIVATTMAYSASAIDFTENEFKNLADGKTVRKPLPQSRQNGFYGGAGFTLIDAPADVVWKALEDWRAYPKIFPRTVDAKEVSRKDNRSLVKMLLGYKILSIEYHITLIRDEKNKTFTFKLAGNQAHDIDSTKGYWKLMPQKDGRTLVAYAIAVQVPSGIVAFLGDSVEKSLERNLIGLPKYLKKYVEGSAGQRYGQVTAKAP